LLHLPQLSILTQNYCLSMSMWSSPVRRQTQYRYWLFFVETLDLVRGKSKLILPNIHQTNSWLFVSVWAPHTNCAINQLDSIQRHGTRFNLLCQIIAVPVVFLLCCHHCTGITLRHMQHKEVCLLIFYKIIHGIVNVPLPAYIHQSSRPLRENHLKYIQPILNVDT